ncbi:hypothetical protein [Streptoalloteichus hindustanus]|uniref:hypothetical protein n=1 Tax=Streptoalloteichus hindustanus TaxID=2017 RepID=UPI0009373FAA|nr:hypothetical protein [Streptoalloteichus hindustanus]
MAEAEELVRQLSLRRIRESRAEPEQGIVHECVWALTLDVQLHYLEDHRSGCSFVVVTGPSQERVEEFAPLVASYLGPWTWPELLAEVRRGGGQEERARALLRAGIGAPDHFDQSFFDHVANAARSPEGWLRTAGVWATSYPFWPEFVPLLREVAEHDADPDLRAEARAIATAIENQVGAS